MGGLGRGSAPTIEDGSRPTPARATISASSAFAPEGQPYLVPQVEFAWAKGAVKKVMDIELPRGILIRGKVVEEGTGHPLAGASLQYYPINGRNHILSSWQSIVASKEDGSYEIVVPPGKGHLLVFGPTSDYVLEEIGSRTLGRGQPGGIRNYAHDIIAYEVKAGDQPHVLAATLRPGKTVRGRVVGPAGQTVEAAAIVTRLHIEAFHPAWRGELHAPRPRRPLRAARARPGEIRAGLLPRRRATSGARPSSSPASRPIEN